MAVRNKTSNVRLLEQLSDLYQDNEMNTEH